MKIVEIISYHSYPIIRILFLISFLGLVLSNYVIFDEIPPILLYLFCLITGIFIGYTAAFHAIKYLREKEFKDNLPLN
jgi:hypothetical protein